MIALLIKIATGLRSLARALIPRRCASIGIEPPPANGSYKGGRLLGSKSADASGWSLFSSQVSRQDFRISEAALSSTSPFLVFSHFTSSSMIVKSRFLLAAQLAFKLFGGISPGCSRSHFQEGSLTSWLKITARAAATGRCAHHLCRVVGYPAGALRFRRADSASIA